MLTEISINDIKKFFKEQNLGEIIGITYRENTDLSNQKYLTEPYSLEIIVMGANKQKRGYVFSKHGLSNIFDPKKNKYAYPVDSEEQFSLDNPEYHALTYAWVKMLASKERSEKYISEEITYRSNLHKKIDEKRKNFAALRSYYKSEYAKLEDRGEQNSKIGSITAKNLTYYTTLAEKLSTYKALQTKCIKHLERRKEEISEQV